MTRIEKYMKSHDIEFYKSDLGDHYFDNIQIFAKSWIVAWDYEESDIMALIKKRELFECWCKRYGYTIYNDSYHFNTVTYRVTKSDDYYRLSDYYHFKSLCVGECAKVIHENQNMPTEKLNDMLSGIMQEWESNAKYYLSYVA